ncbi:MAG TPA: hypothetical protein VGJ92_03985 [Methanocella sp.]|jgi:hypothetical protein
MSGKLDRTLNIGKYKGGEAQIRTILSSQGLDAKSIVLKSNDNHNEAWEIMLANGKKIQLLAGKKNPTVTIKEL